VRTSDLIKLLHVEGRQCEESGICFMARNCGFFRDLDEMSGIRLLQITEKLLIQKFLNPKDYR
jgi:hypothetical protein